MDRSTEEVSVSSCRWQIRKEHLGSDKNQAVDAAADVAEVGSVPGFQLGDGASRVANFTKSGAYGFPVYVAIA